LSAWACVHLQTGPDLSLLAGGAILWKGGVL